MVKKTKIKAAALKIFEGVWIFMGYEGWCRRVDLGFRTRFPYLSTSIYKVGSFEFLIKVDQDLEDKQGMEKIFDDEIRFITAPVKLVWAEPEKFECKVEGIEDDSIPSGFEGLPFTVNQLYNHLACAFPDLHVSFFNEDFSRRVIIVTLKGFPPLGEVRKLEEKLKLLKSPMTFEIVVGGEAPPKVMPIDEVFVIGPASAAKKLNCEFLERDEKLWFDNLENIYAGKYKKDDLYFIEGKKSSCLANFSKFKNCNIRSLILLYDVVYCVLPLQEDMSSFLKEQNITREEVLHLVSQGRIKIVNLQPEVRLDYGFINEAYQENKNAVVSRRALAALCAIDLVGINSSYILSDPALDGFIYPFVKEIATLTGQRIDNVAEYLLWPKRALRSSFDTLNEAGPMGIARYGVNNPISTSLPGERKEELEFEFVVNSDQVHLANALDATYFPFYVDGNTYSDYPFALAMGNALNFYKSGSYENAVEFDELEAAKAKGNPTIDLISMFQVNEFISIQEYEREISSAVIRKGMGSLFAELSLLDGEERAIRIEQYNVDLQSVLGRKNKVKHALDLGVDIAGNVIPFLSTLLKYGDIGRRKIIKEMPAVKHVAEYVQAKISPADSKKVNISVLSRVNRVAKLRGV